MPEPHDDKKTSLKNNYHLNLEVVKKYHINSPMPIWPLMSWTPVVESECNF